MKTMKAYRWHGPGTGDLQLQRIPIPEPAAGEVLVQVQACGLCHSDCHIINGSQSDAVKQRPITLGHEVAGNIVSIGPGVTEVKVGDRICVSLGGHPDRPPNVIGLTMDGGYAEYAIAAVEMLVDIPDNISFEHAAVLTDSLTTAYHAVMGAGEVQSGNTVAIIGLGGLGSTAMRVACLQGATVYGFDIDSRKFRSALGSGAKGCFPSLQNVPDIKFDIVLDFVGMSQTICAALKSLRYRGRLVLVGLAEKDVTFPVFDVVFNKIEIRGCLGGSKDDIRAVAGLIASGELQPYLEEVPFEQLNKSLHRLEAGEVAGRMFTKPRKGADDEDTEARQLK